jgi:hypothetical protein
MPSISALPLAREWLGQFERPDQPIAEALLDAMRLVSPDTFRVALSRLIDKVCNYGEPCAAYAARELTNATVFDNKRNRPSFPNSIGSEGLVAHLITTIARRHDLLLSEPSIAGLKRGRVRRILVVDDGLMSGSRVAKFVRALRNNATISSWLSYGLVRFDVVAYATTEDAIDRITDAGSFCHSKRSVIDFHYAELASTLGCGTGRTLEFVALAKRYGKRAATRWNPALGFKQAFTNLIFAHKCPNTAPAILHSPTIRWKPLFPNGSIPTLALSAFTQEASTRLPAAAQDDRLDRFVMHVSHGIRRPDLLLRTGEFSTLDIEELAVVAQRAGLMTVAWRLTAAGVKRAAFLSYTKNSIPLDASHYYPASLRRPGA